MDKSVSNDAICVLDDDLSVLKAVGRLLKSEGFEVAKFSEPAAFLAAIGEVPCRVAILDVSMPDMNGLEVQAALRQTSPETRVIFFSGRNNPANRETAMKNGAFDFLDKPCDEEQLLGAVRRALNGHAPNRAPDNVPSRSRPREVDFFNPSDLGMSPG